MCLRHLLEVSKHQTFTNVRTHLTELFRHKLFLFNFGNMQDATAGNFLHGRYVRKLFFRAWLWLYSPTKSCVNRMRSIIYRIGSNQCTPIALNTLTLWFDRQFCHYPDIFMNGSIAINENVMQSISCRPFCLLCINPHGGASAAATPTAEYDGRRLDGRPE